MTPKQRFYVVYALLALALAFPLLHRNRPMPVAAPLDSLPEKLSGWTMMTNSLFSDEVLENLLPTDYLSRTYRDASGHLASLYVGYHDGATSGQLHSPRLCLPGSGWQALSEEERTLATSQGAIPIMRSVYQKGESRRLFFYWYRVVGRNLSNPYRMKWAQFTNSLLEGRRDSTLIRIDAPIETTEAEAQRLLENFLETFYPDVIRLLPRAPEDS